jgi:hypothetical protein
VKGPAVSNNTRIEENAMRRNRRIVPFDFFKSTIERHLNVDDNSQAFLEMKMLTYMDRVLKTNRTMMGKESFGALYWLLGDESGVVLLEAIIALIPEESRPNINELEVAIDDAYDFARICRDTMKSVPKKWRNRIATETRRLLHVKSQDLTYKGGAAIQDNIQVFKRAFNLDDTETELCLFFFIISSYEGFGEFFRVDF